MYRTEHLPQLRGQSLETSLDQPGENFTSRGLIGTAREGEYVRRLFGELRMTDVSGRLPEVDESSEPC